MFFTCLAWLEGMSSHSLPFTTKEAVSFIVFLSSTTWIVCQDWTTAVLDFALLLSNRIIRLYIYLTLSLPCLNDSQNTLSFLNWNLNLLFYLLPLLVYFRAHSNGSIRRGFKTDTSEAVTMRSGLGVNLKDVTVFNRGREKGFNFTVLLIYTMNYTNAVFAYTWF